MQRDSDDFTQWNCIHLMTSQWKEAPRRLNRSCSINDSHIPYWTKNEVKDSIWPISQYNHIHVVRMNTQRNSIIGQCPAKTHWHGRLYDIIHQSLGDDQRFAWPDFVYRGVYFIPPFFRHKHITVNALLLPLPLSNDSTANNPQGTIFLTRAAFHIIVSSSLSYITSRALLHFLMLVMLSDDGPSYRQSTRRYTVKVNGNISAIIIESQNSRHQTNRNVM